MLEKILAWFAAPLVRVGLVAVGLLVVYGAGYHASSQSWRAALRAADEKAAKVEAAKAADIESAVTAARAQEAGKQAALRKELDEYLSKKDVPDAPAAAPARETRPGAGPDPLRVPARRGRRADVAPVQEAGDSLLSRADVDGLRSLRTHARD